MPVVQLLLGLSATAFAKQDMWGSSCTEFEDGSYNTCDDLEGFRRPDWMKRVPDNTKLTEMSIPFSHNSVVFNGGDMYQTQSMKLYRQLEVGIRGLDFGVSDDNDKLEIYWGREYQHTTLKHELMEVKHFLDKYPSEGLFLHIEPETGSDDHPPKGRSWGEKVRDALYDVLGKDRILDTQTVDQWSDPARIDLGHLRGKVVVIARGDGANLIPGFISWGKVCNSGYEEVSTIFGLDEYEAKAIKHIKDARRKSNKLFLTYMNTWSLGVYPYGAARHMNPAMLRHIREFTTVERGMGLVWMDYPGRELIDSVIRNNEHLYMYRPQCFQSNEKRMACLENCPSNEWKEVRKEGYGCCTEDWRCFGTKKVCTTRQCMRYRN